MFNNKIAIAVLLTVLILCTSCNDHVVVQDERNSIVSGSTVSASVVIKNPFEESNNIIMSYGASSESDLFEIVTAKMDDQTGRDVYNKYIYKDGKWTKKLFPLNIGSLGKLYRESTSGKLYGIQNVVSGTVVERYDTQKNFQERIELYEIDETGDTIKYIIDNVENIKTLYWLGVNKSECAVFYDFKRKLLLEYDYKNRRVKKSWKDEDVQSLCICGNQMYAINSDETTRLSIYRSGKKRPERIKLPEIKDAMAMDVREGNIFILTEDGIYQSRMGGEDSFDKIMDNKQYDLTDHSLLDYKAIKERDQYVHYIIVMDEENHEEMFEVRADQ